MTRHPTTDVLSRLIVGGLRPGRAARVTSHLSDCVQCAKLQDDLSSVSATLARAQYPAMPQATLARIETMISAEARQRLTAAPAAEPGRRDLPAPRRRTGDPGWRGWRLPGLSARATQLAAVAAALVVAAGASYTVDTNLSQSGAGPSSASSAPAAPAHAPAQRMTAGPVVRYGNADSVHSIETVSSTTNFTQTRLAAQASAAVHDADRLHAPATAGVPSATSPGPLSNTFESNGTAGAAGPLALANRLAGCLGLVAPGRQALLVDLARYLGHPATIIVLAAGGASPAQVWVVGDACSATKKDVITHIVLPHI